MRTLKFLLLAAFLAGARLWAVSPEPYTLGVSFSLRLHGGSLTSGSAKVTATGQPGDTITTFSVAIGGTADSTIKTSWMRPGKTYAVTVAGNNVLSYDLNLIGPDGYDVYVDGYKTNLVSQVGSSSFSDSYQVELRPTMLDGSDDAGAFSGIKIGKSLTWNFGLGRIGSGRPAGRVSFREFDLTNSPDNRARLYYEPELTYGLYFATDTPYASKQRVIYDGPSNQVLRQIMMPQVCVDFYDETAGGYTIKFYTPSQATYSGSIYTFSGSPWKTIRVLASGGSPPTVLTITETEDGGSRVSQLTLTSGTVVSGTYLWTLLEGDGTTWPRTTTHSSNAVSSDIREDTVVVKDASSVVAAKTIYHYELQYPDNDHGQSPWGEELTWVETNPDAPTGTEALTRSFTYHNATTSNSGNFRRVEMVTESSGAWAIYEYYNDWDRLGQLETESHPWGNSSYATPSTGRVITYDYAADWTGRKRLVSSAQEQVNGVNTGLTATTPTLGGNIQGIAVVAYSAAASYSSGNMLTTVTKMAQDDDSVDWDYQGKTFSVKRPDKTQDSMNGYYGSYNPTTHAFDQSAWPWTHRRETTWHGTTDSAGATLLSSYTETGIGTIAIEPLYLVPNKSTKDNVICTLAGLPIHTETFVYTTSGWSTVPIATQDILYTDQGRISQRVSLNGATTQYYYSHGRLDYTIDATGIRTNFAYDALGRVLTSTKVALTGGTDLVTRYTYDAADHVLTETVGYGQAETLVTTRTYDQSGRPLGVTPPGLGATNYVYNHSANTRTTTAPDSSTTIETYQLDGRLASLTGTGVVSQAYAYGIEIDGRLRTEVDHGSSSRWEKTWQDWLGRKTETDRPGFAGGSAYVETSLYDGTTGLLAKTTAPGHDPMLYQYDTHAQLTRSGLDKGNGGSLVLASDDRITDSARYFESDVTGWWLHEETTIYPTSGSASTVSAAVTRTLLTGFASGEQSHVETTDIMGNVVTRKVTVNTSTKTVTSTETRAGLSGSHTEVAVNGLPTSTTGYDGLTFTTGYDSLKRPHTAVDPRTGTITTTYISGSRLVSTTTDVTGLIAAYHYDACGRCDWQKNADGKYVRFFYTTLGQLKHQWGDLGTPVEHNYDATYGDHTSESTYRGGAAWNGANWPTSPGTADTVNWAYDAGTGLLASKTDALGHAVSFDYTAALQPYHRTDARSVVTTYSYDGGTGELTGVGYPSGTHPLAYYYNRLGQITRVDDAAGTRLLSRCVCGKVMAETFDATYYAGRILTYLEDTGSSIAGPNTYGTYTAAFIKGRDAGFELGVSGNLAGDVTQAYYHSDLGQFIGVNTKIGAGTGRDYLYSYTPSSTLVSGYTAQLTGYGVARTYDSHRDLLTKIDSTWSSSSLTRFDYTYTDIGQRKTAKQSGSAFSDYYAGQTYSAVYNVYSFDDRGELTTAAMYRGDTPTSSPSSGDELPGRRYEYRFDTAGNRVTAGATGSAGTFDDEYTANAANQYATKENNRVRVTGTADPAATVAVGGLTSVSRLDRAWSAEFAFTSANMTATKGTVTVFGAEPGAGTGGADLVKTDGTRVYFVPKFGQGFTYDAAGNLTHDDAWDYTYDAENRLTSMQTQTAVIGTGMLANSDARRLEFTYDYADRRVEKLVRGGWNGSSFTTVISQRRYLYDGSNVVAEFDATASMALVRSYTWGLDLTGDLDASGGVGALLQIYDHASSKAYAPSYDGNGNIVSLVNLSGGALAAVYEYSPAGEPIRTDVLDATIADQPFRFSTKVTDAETGLVYYGQRYYSPTLGRFINRDPSEEEGGVNLYAFCKNDGINRWDRLGLGDNDVVTLPPFEVPIGPRPTSPTLDFGTPDYGNPWGDLTTYLQGAIANNFQRMATYSYVPAVRAPNNTWKKDCDGLVAKILNASRTLGSIAGRSDTAGSGFTERMANALGGFLDSGYSAANTFEGATGLLYETSRSVVDLAQSGMWRDMFGSGAASALRGATRDANGFIRDYIAGPTAGARWFIGNAAVVIDVARVGWNLDHGDYGSALQTGAGVAAALLGRAVPIIGATTFLGQQLIDSQQSSAQEAIDAMDASGAAYSQTADRINMSRGLNSVQQWAKEFSAKGCGEFYK